MTQLSLEEIREIYEVMLDSEVVEGPPELWELVKEYFPEFLHKLKPPREQMH